MDTLPKELVELTEKYTGEPGVLPLLYRDETLLDVPEDIKRIIGDYIPAVNYKDLALRAKLGTLTKLTQKEYQTARMPWSIEKRDLAFRGKYYPISREVYLSGQMDPMSLDEKEYIFHLALDNKDLPLLLSIAKKDPELVIEIVKYLLTESMKNDSRIITELRLAGKQISAQEKAKLLDELAVSNEYTDFLLSILPGDYDYSNMFDTLVKQAFRLGDWPLVVKLGHLVGFDKPFTSENLNKIMSKGFDVRRSTGSLNYLRQVIFAKELEDEFWHIIEPLIISSDPIGEQILVEVISSYPRIAKKNLALLREAGISPDVIEEIVKRTGIKFF